VSRDFFRQSQNGQGYSVIRLSYRLPVADTLRFKNEKSETYVS